MPDRFSGRPTRICGDTLLASGGQAALLDDHQRRLAAFDRLRAAAAERGIKTDSDRALAVLSLPEAVTTLIAQSAQDWWPLAQALQAFREYMPLFPLAAFGFETNADEPFAGTNPFLDHIGGGVEAWAFQDADGSIYKFFQPRENGCVGATFRFHPGADSLLEATSVLGSYRNLLEKLFLINAIGGMPTEVVGITPEGILVAKQTRGRRIPEGTDMSPLIPPALIPIPSRFLRCDRDHPRLTFVNKEPWLIADLHDRNVVRDRLGVLRIIDLVAAPFPAELIARLPLLRDWLDRVRTDPNAGLLREASDDEL